MFSNFFMTPGISKANVLNAVSLARHIQESQERKGLALVISQNLPQELSEGAEIPDSAMYELGEVLRIDPKYMKQALNLCSDYNEDVLKALGDMNALPGSALRKKWLKQFVKEYEPKLEGLVDSLSAEDTYFHHTNWGEFIRINGNRYQDGRFFYKTISADFLGDVVFRDAGTRDCTLNVEAVAKTPRLLTFFSGPVREMTESLPKIENYHVFYSPDEKCISDGF